MRGSWRHKTHVIGIVHPPCKQTHRLQQISNVERKH